MAFGPGNTIYRASFGATSEVVAIDGTSGQITAQSPPAREIAMRLVPLPDGEVLNVRSDLNLKLLSSDLQTSRSVAALAPAKGTTVLPDGRVLGGTNGRLVVLDLDAQPLPVTSVPLVGTVFPERIGTRFVLSGPEGARLYDAATFQPIGPVIAELANRWRGQIDLSPSGMLIAGVNPTDGVVVYDAATGARVGPVLPGRPVVARPTFSPDGTKLAMVTAVGLAVYSIPDLSLVDNFQLQTGISLDLVWSPESTEFVYTDLAVRGHRVDLRTREITPLNGLYGAFSNDGTHLSTLFIGEPVRVLDRSSGTVETLFSGFRELAWGRYLPGDTRMFRATANGYFDLIDMTSGSRIGEPLRFADLTNGAYGSFSAFDSGVGLAVDGTYALVGAPGAPVKRIELDPHSWAEMACTTAGRNLTQAEWKRYFGTIAAYDMTCPQYPPGT
jgi:hypothetical protein